MKEYQITYTETLCKKVTVLADSLEEALEKAESSYDEESVVLDPSDFSDGSIVAEDEDGCQLRVDF